MDIEPHNINNLIMHFNELDDTIDTIYDLVPDLIYEIHCYEQSINSINKELEEVKNISPASYDLWNKRIDKAKCKFKWNMAQLIKED